MSLRKSSCPRFARCSFAATVAALLLGCLQLVLAQQGAPSSAPAAAGANPASPFSRPLLLAGPSDKLRARILGQFEDEWNSLKEELPERAVTPRAEELTDLLMSAALLAVVEPDGGHLPEAERSLGRALEQLTADPDPELAMHAGLALAWLAPRLSEDKRTQYAETVLRLAEMLSSSVEGLPALRPRRPPAEGAVLLLSRSLMETPMAVRAGVLYQQSAREWSGSLLPELQKAAGDDGGLPGGVARSALSCEAAVYALALLEDSGQESLFERYPFVRDEFAYYRYAALGEGPGVLPWDDTPGVGGPPARRRIDRILPLVAGRLADPVLQAEAVQRKPDDPIQLWPSLLWSDLSLKPAKPAEWPLAHHFERLGAIAARTGWEPEATVLGFRVAPRVFAEQQDDVGGLLLYRGGWALPSPAVRDVRNQRDHNRIVLWKPPAGVARLPRVALVPRNTGQPQVTPTSKATITAFETNPYFTYAAADLTAAFDGVLTSAVRHVLLIPDPTGKADVVVVCDLVSPGDGEVRPALTYHWTARPDWDTVENVFTVTDGPNRIFCLVAAPYSANPETQRVAAPEAATGLPVSVYRTLLRADVPSTVEVFINVFCITDASYYDMPVRAQWVLGSRAHFEVQVDWDVITCLVGFNADGSPGGTIYFEDAVANKPLFRRPLAPGVTPQKSVDLFLPQEKVEKDEGETPAPPSPAWAPRPSEPY